VVLNSRGQFFLVGLVAMAIIVCGMAYFSSEAKELSRQVNMPRERAMEVELDQYEATLMQALEIELYTGNGTFVAYTVHECEEQGNETFRNFTASCLEQTSGLQIMLNCTLRLWSESQNISRTFNHTYFVPVNITLYNDVNLATETSTFSQGDTVYYKVTGVNGANQNVSFLDSANALKHNNISNMVNYFSNKTHTLAGNAPLGSWSVFMDYGGGDVGPLRKTFNVSDVNVVIETFNALWVADSTFSAGDVVNVNVTVWKTGVFVPPVRVDVTDVWGRHTDYGTSGTIASMNYQTAFTVKSTEATGTLTLYATEEEQFHTNSTTITVS